MTEVEKIARAMAKSVGWEMWDTATNCTHTPDGSEPDDERDYWRGLAQAALAASAPKVQMTDAEIEEVIAAMGWDLDPVERNDVGQFARSIIKKLAQL